MDQGRRIKEKAALALGVPVTWRLRTGARGRCVGNLRRRVPSSRTVVSAVPSTAAPARWRPRLPAARARRRLPPTPAAAARTSPAMSPATRQTLLWSAAAVLIILVCGITYAVVRYRPRPAPVVAVVQPPPPVPEPVADPTPPAPPVDPNKEINEQDLAAAQEMMSAKNFAGAVREHLQPLLERDPENVTALELKRQADDAIEAARRRNRPHQSRLNRPRSRLRVSLEKPASPSRITARVSVKSKRTWLRARPLSRSRIRGRSRAPSTGRSRCAEVPGCRRADRGHRRQTAEGGRYGDRQRSAERDGGQVDRSTTNGTRTPCSRTPAR